MDTDKLGRLTRKTYLLELALAGLEAHAGHSSPKDPQQHYEPVRELADEIHTALRDELRAMAPLMPAVPADTPDIYVENHGSIVLLRPATTAGRDWLKANCDQSGYQPFGGGTLLCEFRYVADIVAGAREAGLEVR